MLYRARLARETKLTKLDIFGILLPITSNETSKVLLEMNRALVCNVFKTQKNTPKFVHFKNLFPLLLRLCRPQEVTPFNTCFEYF